jgi:hypothetical protein
VGSIFHFRIYPNSIIILEVYYTHNSTARVMDGADTDPTAWHTQLALMEQALSKLPPLTTADEYGKDLEISDEELSATADSDDPYDSDVPDEYYYSSDDADPDTITPNWLSRKCATYCRYHPSYALNPTELENNLSSLLSGPRAGEYLSTLCQ